MPTTKQLGAAALAGGLALTLSAALARAGIQDFTVHNAGGTTVYYVYVIPNYSTAWTGEVLGSDTIPAGAQMNIRLDGYGNHCLFDVRIEDANGMYREYYDINLCNLKQVTFP